MCYIIYMMIKQIQEFLDGKISREELAKVNGLGLSTMHRLLKKEGYGQENYIYLTTGGAVSKSFEFWKPYFDKYQEGMTIQEIVDVTGVPWTGVRRMFEKYDISTDSQRGNGKVAKEKIKKDRYSKLGLDVSKEWFIGNSVVLEKTVEFWKPHYERYVNSTITTDDIGKEFGITGDNLRRIFDDLGFDKKGNELVKASKGISMEKTFMEKFGVSHPAKLDDFTKKRGNTRKANNFDRLVKYYGVCGFTILDTYRGIYDRAVKGRSLIRYKVKHVDCGNIFEAPLDDVPNCPICTPSIGHRPSKLENHYHDSLEASGLVGVRGSSEFVTSIETGWPIQIDLYFPENKFGVEFNGLYYHRTEVPSCKDINKSTHMINGKTKTFHKNKTESALKEGISLVHVWEHQNPEIILSMLKSALGKSENRVFARNTEFKELSFKEKNKFFDENHLHGDSVSYKAFGLFDESGELVSAISFRRNHKTPKIIENCRFASKLNTQVVGGFSKLLKHSIPILKFLGYDKIITFADRDWTPDYKNSVYYKNGFKFVGDTGPTMSYTNFQTVWNRQKFQKKFLKKLFPETYNPEFDADQILALNKIYPIHNSGTFKFELELA